MGLPWPGISTGGGNLDTEMQKAARSLLDRWADEVTARLSILGRRPHTSPIFRPWNLIAVLDSRQLLVGFTALQGGVAGITWIDESNKSFTPQSFCQEIQEQLGTSVSALVVFPRSALGGADVEAAISVAAVEHLAELEREDRVRRVGDLTKLAHLEPFLPEFLNDHPNPERNVFIMMRFLDTDPLNEIHLTIKSILKERGFDALRADDRDYTGELWSNVELYMVGSHLGVAVFEDIELRDFNPNVSLELGYMLGRRRRCLILKEKRLPELPADVVHRLYKSFDVFKIEETIRGQILRWIDIDLGNVGR